MSACVDFSVPFTIQSAYGTLTLNDDTNTLGLFLLNEGQGGQGCQMGRDLRVVNDNVPQGDGEIHHRRFAGAYQAKLTIGMWKDRHERACDEQLRLMFEELGLHLNSLLNDPGRLIWTPPGLGDNRMLDEARVRDLPRPSVGIATEQEVIFDSPFPYAYDATQAQPALSDGVPAYLTNNGNVETFPVVKVNGAAGFFQVINHSAGVMLQYDPTRPGAVSIPGGSYIEFDFFRNTAYLNGNGPSRKAGVDVAASDFWTLAPGVNIIEVVGATATVLYNHSYA